MQAGSRVPRRRGLVALVGPLVALVGAVKNVLNLVSEAGSVRLPRVGSDLARSKRRLALVLRRVVAITCAFDWVVLVHEASPPEPLRVLAQRPCDPKDGTFVPFLARSPSMGLFLYYTC